MKHNSKIALGAMLTALSVVILVPSALELFVYALPAMAAMLVMLAVIEMGRKWAIAVYASTAILSLLLVANKEAAVLYAAFFGYYPIVKSLLESRLKRPVEYLLKLLLFNATMVAAYLVMIYVMGMPYDKLMAIEGETGFYVRYAPFILLGLGNIVFVVFDIGLTRVISYYIYAWQKRFRRLFKF